MAKKSYLKQLVEAAGYLFVFAVLARVSAFILYWALKVYAQLFKIILKPIGIKFPFNMKLKGQVIISFLAAFTTVLCFELIPKEYTVYILLLIIPSAFITYSVIDKVILQNEKVCYWFNQRRIWCD
jgi:hypothetical protein